MDKRTRLVVERAEKVERRLKDAVRAFLPEGRRGLAGLWESVLLGGLLARGDLRVAKGARGLDVVGDLEEMVEVAEGILG